MSEADIQQAIRQKNVPALLALMFEPGAGTEPSLSTGRRTENVLWDFKRGCPSASKKHERAWATIARHVLAFHNSGGGVLFFGIDDHSYEFVGTRDRVDSKGFNDQVRRYLGDAIWVEFHREYIQSDQRYLGVAIIPPRGVGLARFVASAPSGDNGDQEFETGESALRRGDSSLVISSQEASQWERQSAVRTLGQTYAVDESYFRLLYPSYETFVTRQELCQEVLQAMRDPRTSITSLIGIGGVGKTALATWAAIHHYEEGTYPFIVSITGRDRELTPWGIHSIDANLSTYETLLDEILEVLGFSDHLEEETPYKEQTVRTLLTESEGLLVVDNLETVDDARVVSFLDSLPPGVSALTTSRRGSVRVAVRPVNVGPMTNAEVARLVKALSVSPELTYAVGLSSTEIARLASACDGIALAIKWAMQRSASAPELLEFVGGLSSLSAKDDELLEFCFRRIYERMTAVEKAIMQVLSLFQRPQYSEAIVVGSGKRADAVHDALAALVEDALVQRAFDPDRNDHVFSLMPITRAFAHSRLQEANGEDGFRRRMRDYFEAHDIKDQKQRIVVREMRQGKESDDTALLDLAKGAERKNDLDSAQVLYEQALARNPTSWRAARAAAEFFRHKRNDRTRALHLYEQSSCYAPAKGAERALIFREWGILLKDCGAPDATDRAIDALQEAAKHTPNEPVCLTVLAQMYQRIGAYSFIPPILAPLMASSSNKTLNYIVPLLSEAYEQLGEIVKLAELKADKPAYFK